MAVPPTASLAPATPQETSPATVTFPPDYLTTIFGDGVINLAQTGEVVKFYIARMDPSVNTPNDNRTTVCAQIVLTMTGFLDAAAFFELAADGYVRNGVVTVERRNAARRKHGLSDK